MAVKADGPSDPTALPRVTVTGKAAYDSTDPYNPDYTRPNASTATKTDTPIMETPVSVQVVPRAVMDDRKANSLREALETVSGVGFEPVDGGVFNVSPTHGRSASASWRCRSKTTKIGRSNRFFCWITIAPCSVTA